uniref:RIIa domain-containing protein 1 isoform X1 n=1 Tax=Pogona vitticeps TaxID=103695 RepID=A0ABM5F550_9SAUR
MAKMVDVGSGLESRDVASLHRDQLEKLLQFKINTKIANEKYLRSHKEVELLLSGFLREVLLQRPENIREFAAALQPILRSCDVERPIHVLNHRAGRDPVNPSSPAPVKEAPLGN